MSSNIDQHNKINKLMHCCFRIWCRKCTNIKNNYT